MRRLRDKKGDNKYASSSGGTEKKEEELHTISWVCVCVCVKGGGGCPTHLTIQTIFGVY